MFKLFTIMSLLLSISSFAQNLNDKTIICEAICKVRTNELFSEKKFTVSKSGYDAVAAFNDLLSQCEHVKIKLSKQSFEIINGKSGDTSTVANSCYFQRQLPVK